ncbi:hypothetical protein ACFE04_020391 [Oxalis oulophora]
MAYFIMHHKGRHCQKLTSPVVRIESTPAGWVPWCTIFVRPDSRADDGVFLVSCVVVKWCMSRFAFTYKDREEWEATLAWTLGVVVVRLRSLLKLMHRMPLPSWACDALLIVCCRVVSAFFSPNGMSLGWGVPLLEASSMFLSSNELVRIVS